ncbi:MAG: hypothetical protein BWK79_04175, partial [Beggiatoa sp. IS2]
VGIGLGTLADLLVRQGYEVTGISPDPYQIMIAEQRAKDNNCRLQCVSFEEFNTLDQSFDVILLQESAQYIKPLTLFNKAFRLLNDRGKILLVDEVGLRRGPEDGIEGLPLLRYTLAQAQRCGFKVLEQIDLSKRAAPTVDYLLRVIQTHRAQLLVDLELSEHTLTALLHSLQLYQQKYGDGRYGYLLLLLEKTELPRWQVTEVTANDQETVRALFAEVFGHTMSHAQWHWKYGEGRGMAMAAWQQGQLVAHYGGLVRELRYFGQPKGGVQIVDVMVSTTERGLLTRRGPYFLVGATFPECYAGYGSRILLGFGFPTQRAIRAAELLGLYAEVGKMVEVRWLTLAGNPSLCSRVRHLKPQEDSADGALINQLWEQMHPHLCQAIVGVRDWHYVQHRYLTHPHKSYELLLVTRRLTGQPLGIVVLYREEALDICKLIDMIAPLNHFPVLIKQARRIVGNWGLHTLTAWITENFVECLQPSDMDGEIHHLDIRIPHCLWYEGPPTEEVKGKWWLMGGDTDFM